MTDRFLCQLALRFVVIVVIFVVDDLVVVVRVSVAVIGIVVAFIRFVNGLLARLSNTRAELR